MIYIAQQQRSYQADRLHNAPVVVLTGSCSACDDFKKYIRSLTFYIKVRKAPRERSLSLKAELAKAGNPVSIEVMFAGKSRLLRKMYFALDSESYTAATHTHSLVLTRLLRLPCWLFLPSLAISKHNDSCSS